MAVKPAEGRTYVDAAHNTCTVCACGAPARRLSGIAHAGPVKEFEIFMFYRAASRERCASDWRPLLHSSGGAEQIVAFGKTPSRASRDSGWGSERITLSWTRTRAQVCVNTIGSIDFHPHAALTPRRLKLLANDGLQIEPTPIRRHLVCLLFLINGEAA